MLPLQRLPGLACAAGCTAARPVAVNAAMLCVNPLVMLLLLVVVSPVNAVDATLSSSCRGGTSANLQAQRDVMQRHSNELYNQAMAHIAMSSTAAKQSIKVIEVIMG